MQLTNNLRLPDALVALFAEDDYTRGDADYSVTGLLSPPRVLQLKQRHDEELTEDVVDRIPSQLGTLLHKAAHESAKRLAHDGVLAEERFYVARRVANGAEVRISGQMDHILVDETSEELTDYKFPSVSSLQIKLTRPGALMEWTEQVNLYALILRENYIPVRTARIIATGLGWTAGMAARGTHPPTQTVAIPIDLWPVEQQEAFLMSRLEAHAAAAALADEDLPLCTPAERWVAPTKYAVMKPGRKSAVRVTEFKAEAEMLLSENEGWWLDERIGGSRRCTLWCAVGRAGLCNQWNAEQAAARIAGTPDSNLEEEALS
jgi:hypothetical protein